MLLIGEETGMKTYLHGPIDYAKKMEPQFRVRDLDLPERRKRYTSSREEAEDAQLCPCGKPKESRTRIVAECGMGKDERDVSEMKKMDDCDMGKVITLPGTR